MCENPDIPSKSSVRRLENRVLTEHQNSEGRIKVDDRRAYFRGKAILKGTWGQEAFEMGLPADTYLDIAAIARNESSSQIVKYRGQTYRVEVNGIVKSAYGSHREIKSVTMFCG